MNDETGRTPAKASASKAQSAKGRAATAPVRPASPRGEPAKPRVMPKPPAAAEPAAPTRAAAEAVAPKAVAPKAVAPKADAPKAVAPKTGAATPAGTKTNGPKTTALKTTALKSAALKAAAAPRAEPPAPEPASEPETAAVVPVAAAAPEAPAPEPAPVADIPAPAFAPAARKAAAEAPSALHEEAFSAVGISALPTADSLAKPYARMMETGADSARIAYSQARESNEAFTQACFESANAASRGMASLNAQMLDLVRANADLTLGLMRSTLTAGSLSEAVKLQTSGARRAYETNAAHIKAIAEATTKLVGETAQPLAQAMTKR